MAATVDDVKLLGDAPRGASMTSCVLNLANTIMGTGVLALPYALRGTGIVPGFIFLVLAAMGGALSLNFLSESARQCGRPATFYSVSEAAYPRLSIAVDLVVVINGFLACLGFLIVAGDALTELHGPDNGGPSRHVWTILSLSVVAPLSLLQKLDALKFTSAVSMLVLMLISLLVILFSFRLDVPWLQPCAANTPEAQCRGPVQAFTDPVSTVRSFATFVVAFTCQQNLFSVTNELEDPTPQRCFKLIVLSISLATFLYAAVGYAGYLTFGTLVLSDIIATYPAGNQIVTVARAGIALVVLTCYPLQAFAVRTSLGTLLAAGCDSMATKNPSSPDAIARSDAASPSHASAALGSLEAGANNGAAADALEVPEAASCGPLGRVFIVDSRSIGIVMLLLATNTSLAMVVTKLGLVVDINGSLAGTAITFIVPGAVFYLLQTPEKRQAGMGKSALVMAIIGTLLVPVSLTAAFLPGS